MFDPRQCATSPIPVGVELLSRKTYLRETQGRRVAQLEHNFNDDKDVWSGTCWRDHVDRRVCLPFNGRCDTPRDAQKAVKQGQASPNQKCSRSGGHGTCPGDSHRGRDWNTLEFGRTPEAGNNCWSTIPGRGVRAKLFSRNSYLNLESQEHAVTNVTVASRMSASRPSLTPLFDLSRCQRGGPLFWIRCGKLCNAT